MTPLDKSLRSKLENTIKEARDLAEAGALAALQQLGVGLKEADAHLSDAEKDLRRRLRAHGRQLGDVRRPDGAQELARLTEEVAYEHWHRMLFARFLAENNLLMYPDPDGPVAVSLEECEEMAADEGARNGWELAARYASKMLPQIFRPDSPSFELELPPEYQRKLENLLAGLAVEVFQASDSLGWVYQFWQAKRKDEVNASEVKIGARELPAVTQLFTEPYMVSFLLDNSLGAWWAARRLSEHDLRTAQTEAELRNKASLPGVPLEYLRFVKVARASSSGSSAGTFSPANFESLHIHEGENLPHWQCDEAIYHVSFRLADSVPEEKRKQWLAERDAIEERAKRANRALTEDEEKKMQFLYSDRIEAFLDSGHGECYLRRLEIGDLVANALRHFDGERYHLHAWCVMPNHVHVIVQPANGFDLSSIIHSWKSFTSNQANKILKRSGPFWQEDAYNHIIRTEKEYHFQIRYVLNNPAEAGLTDWLWVARASSSGANEGPGQDGLATIWQPAAGTFDGWPEKLSELKTLDPCCGSGHFLVAAFLMLVPMRVELEGLNPREAVDAVLRDNLHGLEIDPRCVEIAAFALALTAWRFPDAGGYRALPEMQVACSGLSISVAKEEWKQLVNGDQRMRIAMDWLYDTFADAPVLGSLLDPARSDAAKVVEWEKLSTNFTNLTKGSTEDTDRKELGVVAQGLTKAAELLSRKYFWVITNVPYLARGKQDETLRTHCERYHPEAKNDLATVFLDRCLQLCISPSPSLPVSGSVSLVLPQNWLFLTSYRKFREKLLREETWNLVARMGEGGFESSAAAGAFTILLTISRGQGSQSFQLWNSSGKPDQDGLATLRGLDVSAPRTAAEKAAQLRISRGQGSQSFQLWNSSGKPDQDGLATLRGLDVSAPRTAAEKAAQLLITEVKSVAQARQLENPDARVALEENVEGDLLEKYTYSHEGLTTGDLDRFVFKFWETTDSSVWKPYIQNTTDTTFYSGRTDSIRWGIDGEIVASFPGSFIKGRNAWDKPGLRVTQMRKLPITLYTGEIFGKNAATVIPHNPAHLPAIWCFCSSPEFNEAVRQIDQSLKVTNATLVKVPFDLEHWTKIAEEKYPNGLPKPYSDDPTQWIFHGHPVGSDDPLQVAVARLLGYQWPTEKVARASSSGSSKPIGPDQDGLATMELSDEAWAKVELAKQLNHLADEDGIVCIPAVRGEASAADRLLNLLAAAYEVARASSSGSSESPDQDGLATFNSYLSQLLTQADHAGKPLETWLRDKFFAQHCKRFQHRPFIWHIWDGLRDGFAALVNYHKFDAKALETLIYTYLGDWIARCEQEDREKGRAGDGEKTAAARLLKKKLELIAEGEPPYDIFVRWKPLAEQPIGWNPDLNDGVRLNIRPWVTAEVLRENKKPKLNVKWDKDRGKDVASAPWYHLFGGDRINDHHLSRAEKIDAVTRRRGDSGKGEAG